MKTGRYRYETLAARAGHGPDATTGAVAPPIHLSTTFERDADGSYPKGFTYTRDSNPNRAMLEACVAELEGASASAAFSSGSAAASAVVRALSPGSHVIAPEQMYHGLKNMLASAPLRAAVEVTFVDMTDLRLLEQAMTSRTRLIWVETPSNPLLGVSDIAGIVELAHARGAAVACDNTWTPPDLQPVIPLGVDLIVHATTKYLAGHSDVLGGVVVAKEAGDLFARVQEIQRLEGSVPSPFDCWLAVRGVKTLPYRMRGHCANAMALARFLAEHPRVKKVHFPGLETHPGHALAKRQMRDFGGMLAFEVRGGEAAAIRAAAAVTLFTRATSLGGVESLIEHRASIEGPGSAAPDDLLRVSAGLEHIDDLIEDLEQALGAA